VQALVKMVPHERRLVAGHAHGHAARSREDIDQLADAQQREHHGSGPEGRRVHHA
jgi:hypothetical protein